MVIDIFDFLKLEEKRCPGCGAEWGSEHENGCDHEICSVCGWQKTQCDCIDHDKYRARFGNDMDIVTSVWLKYIHAQQRNKIPCILCGSSGKIRWGSEVIYCICPNGLLLQFNSVTDSGQPSNDVN